MTTDVQEINKKTKKGKLKVKDQEEKNEKILKENEKIVESNKKSKKNKKKKEKNASQDIEEENSTETLANTEGKKGEKRQSEGDESTSKKKKKLKKNKNNGDDDDQNTVGKNSDSAVGDIEDEDDEEKPKKEPSKRQLKREKQALREAEIKEAGKQQNATKALNYVSKWKHAKSEWKFNTVTQTWLIHNLLDDNYVPDEQYATILEYFENCKGSARKQLIDKAMAVIKKTEDCVGKDEDESEDIIETTEYKRARQLLQALPTET